jgi:hypothetical protein
MATAVSRIEYGEVTGVKTAPQKVTETSTTTYNPGDEVDTSKLSKEEVEQLIRDGVIVENKEDADALIFGPSFQKAADVQYEAQRRLGHFDGAPDKPQDETNIAADKMTAAAQKSAQREAAALSKAQASVEKRRNEIVSADDNVHQQRQALATAEREEFAKNLNPKPAQPSGGSQ